MTLAIAFDPVARSTSGFLGFRTSEQHVTPGHRLLLEIREAASRIQNPMLMPALLFGIWADLLQREHGKVSMQLREVQKKTGMMSDYLRQHGVIEDIVNYDSIHQTLVLQHAYLTNGIADFLLAFGPALASGLDRVERHFRKREVKKALGPAFAYDSFDIRHYVDHVRAKVDTELQHRQRMLDRISMYLQVVSQENAIHLTERGHDQTQLYSLMQQQIARENKRDSSALKSISLLTMVFLPATAIAVSEASALASLLITSKTVMAPFITISSDNKVVMTSQFWIFWAVAGPVTLLVIVLWVSWIQRSEIMTALVNKRAKDLGQRRV